MTRLYALLAALGGLLAMIAGAFIKGRSDGKRAEQDKQKDVYIQTTETAKDVENSVATDDRDPRNRLRDEWSRD